MTLKPTLLKSLFVLFTLLSPWTLLITPSVANAEQCNEKQLDILLTNDDGYDKPGIQALHRVFKQAGHRVILAAPAKNASGSSASVTFAAVKVTQAEPDVYAIHGSPATTVLLGVSAFFANNPPDLVISGINKGANLGPATPVSGTVGATVAAILISQPAIPAIAISTDPFSRDGNSDDENRKADLEHLDRVAVFVSALVANLQNQHCDGSALLPEKVALNVNYPPVPHNQIKGVRLREQGKAPHFSINYVASKKDPGSYLPHLKVLPPNFDKDDGDTSAFHQGYITIVPIDADYTANNSTIMKIVPVLQGLKP
ncbi:MAG: hypothetical protein DRR06_10760 [Gammaproteobacteria bacterium]|nr:MAG: hypothetical protein DRR06_10760 [Gammaproteobacteria bacterium]